MKKGDLARRLARESRMSEGAAADQLDRVVNDLLQRVRRGEHASLPGLGTFRPGRNREFKFDSETKPKNAGAKSKKAAE